MNSQIESQRRKRHHRAWKGFAAAVGVLVAHDSFAQDSREELDEVIVQRDGFVKEFAALCRDAEPFQRFLCEALGLEM